VSAITRHLIELQIRETMDRFIAEKVDEEDHLTEEYLLEYNPFGARLIPGEVWKGSRLERSFVTRLGQGMYEQIAKIIAEHEIGAFAENGHEEELQICTFKSDFIEELIDNQRRSALAPNWTDEIDKLNSLNNRATQIVKVTFDLYTRHQGVERYYSFKTVKPNIDQTASAKRDMLRVKAAKPGAEVYFALPYNPAGEGNPYKQAGHHIPYRFFDMENDVCVLIGRELWDHLGGQGTYTALLDVFEETGRPYKERIARFLRT